MKMAICGLTIWMVKINDLIHRIKRKWIKLRLQPIRVFCFHQVSDEFEEGKFKRCDWLQTDEFKRRITDILGEGYTFISIVDAYHKLQHDMLRSGKYAVLTADDGCKAIECIIPWLEEKHIPMTIFVNGKYTDGKSYRLSPKEEYMTIDDLKSHDNITIGHHGWDHVSMQKMSDEEIEESVRKNKETIASLSNFVPFWAYPYGAHSESSDEIIRSNGNIPVYMDGGRNYNNSNEIHRELL